MEASIAMSSGTMETIPFMASFHVVFIWIPLGTGLALWNEACRSSCPFTGENILVSVVRGWLSDSPWVWPCAVSNNSHFWFPHNPWAEKSMVIHHTSQTPCVAAEVHSPPWPSGSTSWLLASRSQWGELARNKREDSEASMFMSCGDCSLHGHCSS